MYCSFSVLHLLIIYLYQLPFIEQYFLKLNTQLVRLLSLRSLYKHIYLEYNWIIYLHLILYWITIYEYHLTRKYYLFITQNNSSGVSINSKRYDIFHFHSITNLFWLEPSNIFYKTDSLIVAFILFILSKAYMLSQLYYFGQ